jgi:tetratricopeptide (TPR) repeat protein
VINLTFALNYAMGGLNVWGYHAVNLLVHTLAGLTLFGVVRRTLLRQGYGGQALTSRPMARRSEISNLRFGISNATLLALAVAVIWIVHPVQTEAVTYISQRAELLMGLFYLLTLYCFIRGVERSQESGVRPQETESQSSERGLLPTAAFSFQPSAFWLFASVLACLLGVMSKENIVTAPVMVLLYDRTFVAGSFFVAWRRRWRYYLGLTATWLPLACLMTGLSQRAVGFNHGVTWWNYALTSCRSVMLYLRLAVWPHPLVFDYGTKIIQHADEIAPDALVLIAFLAAMLMALRYRPVIGFVGAWFFVILAPTTSVVPVALQPIAEHRLYLSLAAVIALVVCGLYRLIGRRVLPVCVAAAVGLGWLSVQRNKDYGSKVAIWNDTVAKCPDNERARNNLGDALFHLPGRLPDAIAQFEAAVQIKPDYADAHNGLGGALSQIPGRLPDAIAEYETALRIDPSLVSAHANLANALAVIPDRVPDAIAQFEIVLQLRPEIAEIHDNYGTVLLKVPGRLPDAIAQFETALRIKPDFPNARKDLEQARQMLTQQAVGSQK